MSTSSSVLNLYDSVSGDSHYQQKVSSDKVTLLSNKNEFDILAPKVNIINHDGKQVLDVVSTMLDTILSVSQEALDRQNAVIAEGTLRSDADVLLQNNINSENAAMVLAVNTEKTRAMGAETVLTNNLVAESGARQSAITSEINARSGADQTLRTDLDQEVLDRKNAVLAETSARNAAFVSEIATRSSNDATLQSNIDNETSTRSTQDISLATAITQESSNRGIAIAAEKSLRESAVSLVQTNLNSESATRVSQNTILQNNITSAITARVAAVTAEASARSAADENLASLITAEKVRAISEVQIERNRIDSLLNGTSVDLNQLQELINAYQSSDASILTTIQAIQNNISLIQSQLSGTDDKLNSLLADIAVKSAALLGDYQVSALAGDTLTLTDNDRVALSNDAMDALVGQWISFDEDSKLHLIKSHVGSDVRVNIVSTVTEPTYITKQPNPLASYTGYTLITAQDAWVWDSTHYAIKLTTEVGHGFDIAAPHVNKYLRFNNDPTTYKITSSWNSHAIFLTNAAVLNVAYPSVAYLA